jgi:hypothetical protein
MDHRDPALVYSNGSRVGWIFQTYVDPDPEMEGAIRAAVHAALGNDYVHLVQGGVGCGAMLRGTRTRAMLANAYRNGANTAALTWRDEISFDRRKRRADRSTMNRTTLSLFSGPYWDRASSGDYAVHEWGGDAKPDWAGMAHRILDRNGWLLLGDAVLADEDILRRLTAFFGSSALDYLSRTLVFTAPHHGSAANLTREAIRRLGVPHIAVVPAGDKTHYGHPSGEVMDMLRSHGIETVHVHAKRKHGFIHGIGV